MYRSRNHTTARFSPDQMITGAVALFALLLTCSSIVKAAPSDLSERIETLEAEEQKILELLRKGETNAPVMKLAPKKKTPAETRTVVEKPQPIVPAAEINAEIEDLLALELQLDSLSRQIEKAEKAARSVRSSQHTLSRSLESLVDKDARQRADEKRASWEAEKSTPRPRNYALPYQPGWETVPSPVQGSTETLAVASISSKNASFRSVPSTRGTRLYMAKRDDTVLVEKRRNDWYRVIHSSGIRGWVAGKLLTFPARTPNSLVSLGAAEG